MLHKVPFRPPGGKESHAGSIGAGEWRHLAAVREEVETAAGNSFGGLFFSLWIRPSSRMKKMNKSSRVICPNQKLFIVFDDHLAL